MALSRNRSWDAGKWPEFSSRVAGAVPGPGLVFQTEIAMNGRLLQASTRVSQDGGVSGDEIGAMLRELAWMADGKGEPPNWAIAEQEKAKRRKKHVIQQALRYAVAS